MSVDLSANTRIAANEGAIPRPPSNRTYPAHARCRHRSPRNSARHRWSGTILSAPICSRYPGNNRPAGWWFQVIEALWTVPPAINAAPRKWRRVRQIGLNGHLARQLHCAGSTVHVRADSSAPQPHRRHRSHRPRSCECAAGSGSSPRVREVQTARQFGTNQQQAGDELGRTGRIDADLRLGSRQGCRRRNSERQTANLAVVINRCTQLFQTVKHRLHRTLSLVRRHQNSLGHLQTGQGRARNASPCRPVRRTH